jgi:hypothetical protein
MPSETFYCPQCKTQLTKSAQAYVLGEAYAHQATSFIMGSPPSDVICPACRGRIDAMKMIKGEYDSSYVKTKYDSLYFIVVALAIVAFKFVLHWSLVAAILVGLFGGIFVAQLIIEMLTAGSKNKK